MNFTREIYWNVGHGVVLPMYLFAALTLAILIYGFVKRIRVYRQGKPLQRLDHLPARIVRLVKRGLGQLRVMLVKAPGITHALLFWGMLLLFIGTLLVMAQADFTDPVFNLDFLKGTFYLLFSLTLDIAGAVVIVMLCGFIVRRYFYKPKGLVTTKDDYLIQGLLIAILLTAYLVEGARMAVTEINSNPTLALFSPVGLLVARLLTGLSESTLREIHRLGWWTHFFLAMSIIVAIPFTKFRHLFTTPINYLFADLREKGSIETINLEAADADHFGAAVVADLSWKDIFDADACTSCKRCQDRCPAWITDKPLSPMKVVQQIGEVAFNRPQANLIETVTADVLWACTTCFACQEICPADIEHVNKILEMRRHLVLMQGEFPGGEVMTAVNNTEVNGNPFGLAYASRGDWADGLDVQRMADGSAVDILYFAGCYASFDKRNQEVARNFIKICNAAGIKVGILGKEEKCCGEPVRKLGNEYLYQLMATENIKKIKTYGVTRIVTTCPHCFNTLGRDYRDLGLDVEVEHYTTFLDRLISQGALHLKPQSFDCTYHDSCYLGRYKDIVREPRNVLRAAGGSINEMKKTGHDSFCCGGGGGRVLAEEKLGRRINVERVKMAQATGAPLLVSNCPFCLTMFEDGIKTGGIEGKLQVRDLTEIIVERISQ
ncbi:MAG: heterodisulfide reductase-related iron-sulfur binding cluster [Chloroflexi bacterium]|nr:heterodisulfide reductase-related iron-sulfur binding cluster [Chloroflexota bacterium]